jgi:hypothetical protein
MEDPIKKRKQPRDNQPLMGNRGAIELVFQRYQELIREHQFT